MLTSRMERGISHFVLNGIKDPFLILALPLGIRSTLYAIAEPSDNVIAELTAKGFNAMLI